MSAGPRCGGSVPVPSAGSRARSSDASWLEKIAPKIGTPIAPPIERKSVAVDVATPRFS